VTVNNVTGNGTMRLDLSTLEAGITDAAGNTVSGGYTAGPSYTIEHTPPTVSSVTAVNVGPSNSSTQVFVVDFSEGVSGVTAADFTAATTGTVAAGSITVTPASPYSNSYTVTVNGVTGNGTLGLNVNASGTGIADAAGNAILGGFNTGASITIANAPPAVTSIALVDATTNNLGTEQFTVTFSESVSGVTAGDFMLTNGGTVVGTIASVVAVNADVLGHATTYTVTVDNVTGDGTMRLDLAATESGITDYAGNMASGGYIAGPTYSIEHTPPAVTSIALLDPATNNASSEQFTVNFSEAVSGVDAGDFALTNGGTVSGSITAVAAVNPDANGRASAYTVTVSNVTGDGTMKLNLSAAQAGIEDAAGNAASGGFTSGPTYTIEHTAPVVSSINLVDAATNNLASEQFTVTFSASVAGVTAGDFVLTDSSGLAGTIGGVSAVNPDASGRASTYTVTVNGVTGDGTMRLDLNAAQSGISDAAGNTVSGGYTVGPSYTVQQTAPAVTSIALVDAATNNAATEQFTVNFSENVGGVTAGDFVLTTGGSVTGTIGTITAVNPGADGRASAYTVTVTNVTGDGTLRLDVSAAQSGITDAAGNAATGAYTAGPAYTLEHTAPVVASIGLVGSASNDNASEQFTVSFSENVGGVDAGDFVLSNGGTVSGAITGVVAVDPDANGRASVYTVTVSGVSGVGTMRLDLGNSTAGITDAAGNTLTGGYDTGPSYTLGTAVPAVQSIAVVGPTTSNATSEQFTVQFSEDVSGVGIGDFVLTTTGTVAGTVAAVTGSGDTYTVTVDDVSGDGTLRLDLNGTGPGIVDGAAHPLQTGFTGGQVVTLEQTPPSVTAITAVGSSPNNAATEQYTVTFSQNVSGVTAADFALVNSGSVAGTISSVTGSGDTYTVTVSNVTGNGTMRLDVNAGTDIVDAAGNPLAGGYTGAVITLEHAAPTVTSFVPVGSSPNDAASEQYTITFSENVSGVDLGDFTLLHTGTAAGKITAVTGSGNSYIVTLSDVSGDGTLQLALNASASGITDAAGNSLGGGAGGSGSLSEPPITVEHTPPAVTSIDTVGANPNDAGSERYTVTFSENVSGVTAGDFSLATTGTASGKITSVSGSGNTYVVTVSEVTGEGTMRLDLDASATGIRDAAGNPISAGFTAGETFTVQHSAPVVESVSAPPSNTYMAGETFEFTVTYDEPVVVDTAGGRPSIPVNLQSGGTHNATYVGGSGTDTLTFEYTVGPSDQSPNGITLGTAIALNGATLADAAGNAGSLTLANVASDRGVIVGGVPPQLPLPGQGVGSSDAGSGAAAAGGASTPTVYAGYVDNNLYTSNELATARYVPLMAEIDPLASSTQTVLTDVGDIVIDQSVQPPLAVVALLEPVNTSFAFSVPIGTFQFDPGAVVAVTARLADGSALPQWLAFDPSTGRFEGSAPKGWSEHLHIIVSARDQNGRDVMLPVEVQFARPGDAAPTARLVPRPHRAHASVRPGKDSLAVQFARYGRHARERELVTLANHG
jgi:PBP1b-binding outer membrane lipoprotein LpoB